MELINPDSEGGGNLNPLIVIVTPRESVEEPKSTARRDAMDELNQLNRKIDTRINEGLTLPLTQLKYRLKNALEGLCQTVAASLSARLK